MKSNLIRAAALTLVAYGAAASQAAPTYGCKVLDQNDASYDFTSSRAISNKGHIVGSVGTTGGRFGALWRGKQVQLLTAMEAASDVNDLGQVVGYSSGALPVMWQEGTATVLPALPSSTDGLAIPQAINNKGHIVGVSSNGTNPWLGVVWVDGQIKALPFTAKYRSSSAGAINNLGDIIGSVESSTDKGSFPVIWERKSYKMRVLQRLTKYFTAPTAINENRLAVGYGNYPDGDGTLFHAVGWKADGSVVDLGTLAGGVSSAAQGINGAGVIVGNSSIDSWPSQFAATVWYDMSQPPVDLNTLVDANGCHDNSGAPYVLKVAMGINNTGVITAYGNRNGNDAKQLAFRLTPQ